MGILPGRQPVPALRQAQVQTHLIQIVVRQSEQHQALCPTAPVGLLQMLAQIKGSIQQPAGIGLAVGARKMITDRQQPGEKIKSRKGTFGVRVKIGMGSFIFKTL